VGAIEGHTLDLEPRNPCIGLRIRDAHQVEFTNITGEAPGAQSGIAVGKGQDALVYIDETYTGSTTQIHVSGYNSMFPTTLVDWVRAGAITRTASALAAGCTTIPVSGLPAGASWPLPGTPVRIMDGGNSEVVFVAYGYGGGSSISVDAGARCASAHASGAYLAWNPVWWGGPGPSAVFSGKLNVPAGSMSVDASGVVTVTVPTDNYIYEDRHIGETIAVQCGGSADAAFCPGRATITGLGQYCTSAGAQSTCANNQFQYKLASAPGAASSSTQADTVHVEVHTDFDYRSAGDSSATFNQPGMDIPELLGDVNLRSKASAKALNIYAMDSNNHQQYNRLALEPGQRLPYAGGTTDDWYIEPECNSSSLLPVNCGALHVRTDTNTPLYLGANGVDDWEITPAGQLQQISTGNVAATAGAGGYAAAGPVCASGGGTANTSGCATTGTGPVALATSPAFAGTLRISADGSTTSEIVDEAGEPTDGTIIGSPALLTLATRSGSAYDAINYLAGGYKVQSYVGVAGSPVAGSLVFDSYDSSNMWLGETALVATGGVTFGDPDTGITRSSAGVVNVGNGTAGDASGTLAAGAIAVPLTSTAAISGAVPVKADVGNAGQVVMTTASDTGPGVVLGVCTNSPAAGAKCNVAVTGLAALTLGSGTCSIGQLVTVDNTTDGRVLCTPTYAAGTVIGVAMQPQSSAGSTFNVMVGLR